MILGSRYFQMSNSVFYYNLTPIQLAVYCYLLSCTGTKDKCWPAMKTIAACCRCSKNAARSAVDELVRRGFISKRVSYRIRRNGRTQQSNNTYFILPMPPLDLSRPSTAL